MDKFLSNYAAENAVLPLDVALYRACKDRHGSKAAIAEINGFNSMVFSKCVDVNHQQYHLKPEHIEAIVSYTKDIRILQSLAAAHGDVVVYEIPHTVDATDLGFMANIGVVSIRVGELFSGLSDSLHDGKISAVEMAMIEKHAMELISAVVVLKKIARLKADQDDKGYSE